MVNNVGDVFREINFFEIHNLFLNQSYYEYLFPFLLAYALLFTVLSKVGVFQYTKGDNKGKPIKPIIIIVSLIVSFFGISFETSPGYNVGKLLMVMFPNISAITMGILSLYVVGAMLGQNFFKGLFRKDHSAYLHIVIGVIGLGSIVYYMGIVIGFWDFNPLDTYSQWNVIIAFALLIMGISFLFIDLVPIGILFLLVFGTFVYNYGQGNILEYFIDPVVFIIIIVIILLSWVNSDKDKKTLLEEKIRNAQKSQQKFHEKFGKPKPYEYQIYDILDQTLENNRKKFKKFNEKK